MSSIFTKIVKGEIPCHKVAETDDFIAFLDIRPLTEGHTLVIPKKETDYIFDLDDEMFTGLHLFTKIVARAIERSVKCARIGVCVMGLEVPHAHIHLIPINSMDDMNFSRPKLQLSDERLTQIAENIRKNLPKGKMGVKK